MERDPPSGAFPDQLVDAVDLFVLLQSLGDVRNNGRIFLEGCSRLEFDVYQKLSLRDNGDKLLPHESGHEDTNEEEKYDGENNDLSPHERNILRFFVTFEKSFVSFI